MYKVVGWGVPYPLAVTDANKRKVVAYITQGNLSLGGSAILSNGTVSISGGANIATSPANQHNADVFGNGNVNLGGAGYDDGTLVSHGSVTGSGYYGSLSNQSSMPFPDTATTAMMQSNWIALSQAVVSPATTPNIIQASNLFKGGNKSEIITAPAYINGNIQLTSTQSITFVPSSPTATNQTVYINGNLKSVSGSTITNAADLIVGGTFTMAGQSSYAITPPAAGNPMPTLAVLTGDITLNGGSTNVQWGIIYSVNGGIKVNGNAVFTGALVAGGVNSSVTATGTYQQYFVSDPSLVAIPQYPVLKYILEQ
jgi:hypothetical protein